MKYLDRISVAHNMYKTLSTEELNTIELLIKD